MIRLISSGVILSPGVFLGLEWFTDVCAAKGAEVEQDAIPVPLGPNTDMGSGWPQSLTVAQGHLEYAIGAAECGLMDIDDA